MQKRINPILKNLLLLIITIWSINTYAQVPQAIKVDDINSTSRSACPQQSAGTVTLKKIPIKSNNDLKFLCKGDQLVVTPAGYNLTGDPVPATPPGVGYAFYDKKPTVSGTTLQNIVADPSLNRKTPIVVNGQTVNQQNGIWITLGNPSTFVDTFVNDLTLQNAFNNGAPADFWFAPITIDNFATNGYEQNGSCVNVSVNEAFNVVYLNPITITNFTYLSGTSASFKVEGGMSQYDNSTNYSIIIKDRKNPTIIGTVTSGVAKHDNTVTINVPQNGSYTISVTDSKSCDAIFRKDFPFLSMEANDKFVNTGDTVCVDIKVQNFKDIKTFNIDIDYDSTILKFIDLKASVYLDITKIDFNNKNGKITVSKDDLKDPTIRSAPDGAILFSLCFVATGPFGSKSPIILSNPNPIDNATDINDISLGINYVNGSVNIGKILLDVKIKADSLICSDLLSSGTLTITPIGGLAPYTYTFFNNGNPIINGSGNISSSNASAFVLNRPAGTYTITVVAKDGETKVVTATIYSPPPLVLSVNVKDPSCFDSNDGKLSVRTQTGGTPPYKFLWNNNSTLDSIVNIPGGTYSVTMTDSKGCTTDAKQSIGVNPIFFQKNIIPATCLGSTNGKILVNVSGGVAALGYKFNWSTGKNEAGRVGSQIDNLNPGLYFLTVTDDKNCTKIDSFVVPALKSLRLNATVRNVTCYGLKNGFINVDAITIGTQNLPILFNWSPNGGIASSTATTSYISNLNKGTFTLSIEDRDFCKLDTTFKITEPDSFKVNATVENLKCNGTLGKIQLNVIGATPSKSGYTYLWSNNPLLTTAVNDNLQKGSYTVTISDSIGCSKILTFDIKEPKLPTITAFNKTNPLCATSGDGIIEVIAIQGDAAITNYSWSGGRIGKQIGGLNGGTYYLTITAADGCVTTDSAQIIAPQPLVLVDTVKVLPVCPTEENGSISFFVQGGSAPYTFALGNNPPSTFQLIPGLKAGSYPYTIRDKNNCPALTGIVTIRDPDSIRVAVNIEKEVSCYSGGVCDGRARALVLSGGAGSYTFTWGTSSSTGTVSIASNLCKGNQTLKVSDLNCTVVVPYIMTSPDSITVDPNSLGNIKSVSCYGYNDGIIDVNFKGGIPPYRYVWDDNSTSIPRVNLKAGLFSVIVTDNNGCTQSYSPIVSQPPILEILLDSTNTRDARCFSDSTGQIRIAVGGGNGEPYTYAWSNTQSITPVANNLPKGDYTVIVSDPKGCKDTLTHTLSEPNQIFMTFKQPTTPICNDEATVMKVDSAFGGLGNSPFVYTVDFGTSIPLGIESPPIFAGPHIITVIETLSGCSIDTSIYVDEPDPIIVDLGNDTIVGLGDSVLLQPIYLNSALPIDSVVWTPTTFLRPTNDPLKVFSSPNDDIIYTLTVYDLNKCKGTDQILVELERNRNVYIPNTFTPNDDGKNDLFTAFTGPGVSKINSFDVYDRWGNHLYNTKDISQGDDSKGWDGSYKAQTMDPGVYVYIIQISFIDGSVLTYRGDITLLK
jgi:gliding motility-associated-like protein